MVGARRTERLRIVRVRPLGLLFHREIVLHGLHARDLPGRPGRVGTGHDVPHLARERDDPRIRLHINIGVLQMGVFREVCLHAYRNGFILLLHCVACRRGDYLQFVFHRLDAIESCGDPLRRTLRLVGIDLPAEHHDGPAVVSTSICLPLTRESAARAILVFAVSHESLTSTFSLETSTAVAGVAMNAAPTTSAVQSVTE